VTWNIFKVLWVWLSTLLALYDLIKVFMFGIYVPLCELNIHTEFWPGQTSSMATRRYNPKHLRSAITQYLYDQDCSCLESTYIPVCELNVCTCQIPACSHFQYGHGEGDRMLVIIILWAHGPWTISFYFFSHFLQGVVILVPWLFRSSVSAAIQL
jgi:hypothetical protein